MPDKAVLVVSHGSSFESARREIENAETAIAKRLGYKLYTAVTSGMVLKTLEKRRVCVMSPEQAMDAAAADGVELLLVQPTHLLYGDEYNKLCKAVESKKLRFRQVAMGKPLLADYEDIERVLMEIDIGITRDSDEAVVLMGHGTGHCCNAVYAAADFYARRNGFEKLFIGTAEAWPDIDNVIKCLKMSGVKRCVAAPMMLAVGDCTKNKLAGMDKESWRSRICAAGISVRCVESGLGAIKGICEIYADHAEKAAEEFKMQRN